MTPKIEPTIEQTPKDPMTEFVESHPAFGMVTMASTKTQKE